MSMTDTNKYIGALMNNIKGAHEYIICLNKMFVSSITIIIRP